MRHRWRENFVQAEPDESFDELMDREYTGNAAKSSSRLCFTFVNVTTPTAARTPLPTKFAVAEKHMARFLRCEHYICDRGTQKISEITAGTVLSLNSKQSSNLRNKHELGSDMRKDFAPALETAMHHALEYLRTVDGRPVGPTVSLETLRQRLCKEWNQDPLSAESVVRDLVKDIEGGLNNSVNARFYAWVIGGSLPSALAADWLTSTWDQNAGLYAVSPASAIVEEAVGSWLKDLFRLPASSSFALVTGCQMAHATCLAAARTWLLKKHGWDVERQGMSGSPQIRVLCGVRHATIDRTLRCSASGINRSPNCASTAMAHSTQECARGSVAPD